MLHTQKYQNHLVGSLNPLSDDQMRIVFHHLDLPNMSATGVLGGRSQPVCYDLNGYGSVMLKKYYRGGAIRHVNDHTHLKWGVTRPEVEFMMLNRVRELGINVPEPFIFITKGRWLYQGWLVTQRIENTCTLAELAACNRSRAENAIGSLNHQVSLLIEHRIHHIDLHPGNVLINDNGVAYLIDFDKARNTIRNREKLKTSYQKRWRRAIEKHRLPRWLGTAISDEL